MTAAGRGRCRPPSAKMVGDFPILTVARAWIAFGRRPTVQNSCQKSCSSGFLPSPRSRYMWGGLVKTCYRFRPSTQNFTASQEVVGQF